MQILTWTECVPFGTFSVALKVAKFKFDILNNVPNIWIMYIHQY